jgi:hypothetical protein
MDLVLLGVEHQIRIRGVEQAHECVRWFRCRREHDVDQSSGLLRVRQMSFTLHTRSFGV